MTTTAPAREYTGRTWDSLHDVLVAHLREAQSVRATYDPGDADEGAGPGYHVTTTPKCGTASLRAHVEELWAGPGDDLVSVEHIGIPEAGMMIDVVMRVKLCGMTGLRSHHEGTDGVKRDGWLVRVTFEWEEEECHVE